MKIITAFLLLGILLLGGAFFIFRWVSGTADGAAGPFGFRDLLKNGAKREAYFDLANPQNVEAMSEKEIAAAVDGYVHSQGQSREYWIVRALGERAVPALLRTLSATDATAIPVVADWNSPDAPIQRALDMLRPYACPEIIPYVLPLISAEDYRQRADAGLKLASLGSDEVIEPVLKSLSDPEGHVRSMTCIGISEAITEGRATPGFRAAMFAPLVAELEKPLEANGAYPIDLLMKLDPDRATALLNTPQFLRMDNRRMDDVLGVLRRHRVKVDEKVLWTFIEANPPAVKSNPGTDAYCAALLTLAAQNVPGVEKLIDAALAEKPSPAEAGLGRYGNGRIERQEAAARALWIREGLPDPSQVAWKTLEAAGDDYAKIPQSHRDILLVNMLDAEVCNGGFDQYYFNSSGDEAMETLAALRRIGDEERARILQSSVEAFGRKGPSPDREKRNVQQEKMTDEQGEKLSALDTAWYEAKESLAVKLYFYCLGRKTDFAGIAVGDSSEPEF